MSDFKPNRADGRSDARVLIEAVGDAEAGTVFTHDELIGALSVGTDRQIDRTTLSAAVRCANDRLLKEKKRTLHAVRGVGYRLAAASDHLGLALNRRSRADRQLEAGYRTLQHVRWDEMDANAKAAHEGQLIVMGAIWQAVTALDKRQQRLERIVRSAIGPGASAEVTAP